MNNFWSWLVNSSENPQNISLTIKGALGTLVSIIVVLAPILHWNIGLDQLNTASNLVVQVVGLVLGIVSVIATISGLIRKLWNTLKPTPTAPTSPVAVSSVVDSSTTSVDATMKNTDVLPTQQ